MQHSVFTAHFWRLCCLVVLLLGSTGCLVVVEDGALNDSPADDLEGTYWQLDLLIYQGESFEPGRRSFTLEFESETSFDGKVDCNRYFGDYDVPRAGKLYIQRLSNTEAACLSPTLHDLFLEAMRTAERYTFRDRDLWLYANGEELVLRFRPH